MLSLTSTGTELRRFRRGTLPKVAVGAMLLIPLLYGALYLWAFWNPTGNMSRLPVALVNADQPADAQGSPLHAGSDLSSRLLGSGTLDWVSTSASDAAAGVADGTYYFALTIPADFSTRIASEAGADPASAELMVTYNDANSFLASTLGREAMSQVRTAVSDTVSERAVDAVLVGLGSARNGFAQASDGALTLRAASGDLAAGAHQVSDGAAALASGAADAAGGAAKVATGATGLASGASSAAKGAADVATGAATVAQGTTTASSSGATLAAGAGQVATGTDAAVSKVAALAGQLPALSSGLTPIGSYLATHAAGGDAQAATLLAGLQKLSGSLPTSTDLATMQTDLATLDSGAHSVADGATALSTGLQHLAAGTGRLSTGAQSLATGTSALASGTSQLSAGANSLATGTSKLATGSGSLASGASALAAGAGQLGDGTQSLATALASGTSQLPDDSNALRARRAAVISSPVTVASTDTAQAEGFGEGFAPFFIPLALFVGALITWLLLRPLPSRALATPVSGWRATLAGYLPALAIGVGQVAIMLAVIHYGVGLHYSTVPGTVVFTLLVVASFLALQQMLNAVLGSAAGKVVILALLMLQLASSGGTYPVETTPQFFRVIHPLLPMSYAVSGLREVITGGIDARLGIAVAYLVVLLVASLAVTSWRAGRMRTWTLGRLHPVLEI
jgi:putative membrane protein